MDVAVVRWPAEAERLERLQAARAPRLLIVEDGHPPVTADELQDWLRAPADEADLRIRIATLRARATQHPDRVSLERGVLRAGTRTVVLPPIQERLAGLLLERMDTVVGRDALTRRAWPTGAPAGRNVLDVHIAKLRRLLAGSGIDIRTVHRRGYLLHRATGDDAAPHVSTPS